MPMPMPMGGCLPTSPNPKSRKHYKRLPKDQGDDDDDHLRQPASTSGNLNRDDLRAIELPSTNLNQGNQPAPQASSELPLGAANPNQGNQPAPHPTSELPPGAANPNQGNQPAPQPTSGNLNPDDPPALEHTSDSSESVDQTLAPNKNKNIIPVRQFKLSELQDATENFSSEVLGKGEFGTVYKGRLKNTDQMVAIRQLDCDERSGTNEFAAELLALCMADHPNVVKLIGYCAEKDEKLLVYEYMPKLSLDVHLHDPDKAPLDWKARMKIATGAAEGLEYLHDKMEQRIIHRNIKPSNILLGEDFHPKLSDFRIAKVGPIGDETHVSTEVIGTPGYLAPDYEQTGQLKFSSDIYSFGVLLLEIITGRKALDTERSSAEINLVDWARPLLKDKDEGTLRQMADPALGGRYPEKALSRALDIAERCIQDQSDNRPLIAEVVSALEALVPPRMRKQGYHEGGSSSHGGAGDDKTKPE